MLLKRKEMLLMDISAEWKQKICHYLQMVYAHLCWKMNIINRKSVGTYKIVWKFGETND